jgi:hypothetical protein
MSKIAYEYRFGAQSSYVYGVESYDSTKLGLGSMIFQANGSTEDTKYVSPIQMGFARPVETGGAVPAYHLDTVPWSSTIDWVFFADQAAAAATRRIQLYEFNRTTSVFTWKGFITVAFPFAGTQGTYVVRGFQMIYDKYTTGTASCSGTTVTGSSTTWSTAKICPGSRIGFGTTTPSSVSRWYEISAVGSDTSLTLTESATISSGTYVIEELRAVQVVTNATTSTNGGVFISKGLKYEAFNGGGTSIAAATNADQVARTNYWIGDAATSTNIAPIGCDYIKTDWTTQHLYVLDTVANPILYKYNMRAALTVVSGKSTDAFVLKSGSHGALTGTPSQNNNFVIATTSHGSGSGIPCGYFTTTTRLYRTADITTIVSNSTTWAGDNCLEVPPGSSTTSALTATLNNLVYSSILDKFYISTASRCYCTQYRSDGSQWDRVFLMDDKQTPQVTSSSDVYPHPSYSLGVFLLGRSNGILYMAQTGLTAITNFVFAIPTACDWEYTANTNQVVITPEISTANVASYVRAYIAQKDIQGGASVKNLGVMTEPVRLSVRTSGISDNSGSWTVLPASGDMSSISSATSCQLKLEFKIMGQSCVPSQVMALGVIYEDLSTDSHYQPSVGNSSLSSKQFAWRFATAFGGTVPRLKIRLYDAVSGSLLVTDDSTTRSGTWEKSTDGGSNWVSWTTDDKGNDTTYLRFTPASLGDNIRVRALLTLY